MNINRRGFGCGLFGGLNQISDDEKIRSVCPVFVKAALEFETKQPQQVMHATPIRRHAGLAFDAAPTVLLDVRQHVRKKGLEQRETDLRIVGHAERPPAPVAGVNFVTNYGARFRGRY